MVNGERVALVDKDGNRTGDMEKLQAHEEGRLHEAFSVLVFNEKGELLLQQRSAGKYHSAGKWSNTCCSHPDPFDHRGVVVAAQERLQQEMGFTCDLDRIDAIYYRAELDNGLVEHEYDHILVGYYVSDPVPNQDEVQGWRWTHPDQLASDMQREPEEYSAWLGHIMDSSQLTRLF
jgi:isopentenyl-diphosphate delta-isomerase